MRRPTKKTLRPTFYHYATQPTELIVLVFINVVTLHWAWLVRGWVTVSGWINYFVAEPGTQVYTA